MTSDHDAQISRASKTAGDRRKASSAGKGSRLFQEVRVKRPNLTGTFEKSGVSNGKSSKED